MAAIFSEDRTITGFATVTRDDSPAPLRGGADWCGRWIMVFLAVGVAARLIRYLLRFPLWGDEAMLAMNLLDRDYAGLMQPLDFHQVAPLLFLWCELTAVKLLGFNEWSLRLFPLLCSIASLFLFHRLARTSAARHGLGLGGGDFCRDLLRPPLCRGSEALCRRSDGLDALALAGSPLVATARRDPLAVGLTAVVPLALGLSYPAVFVAGGASLAVAAVLLSRHRFRIWSEIRTVGWDQRACDSPAHRFGGPALASSPTRDPQAGAPGTPPPYKSSEDGLGGPSYKSGRYFAPSPEARLVGLGGVQRWC